MKNVDKFHLS